MKKIKYILLSLLGIFGLLLIWGLLEPYTIDTEEEVAEIPNLPSAWQGQRVALITDWQIGMWLGNTPTIRRTVEKLIEERPALVLIAGDFVYHAGKDSSPEINEAIEIVRPLIKAGIPTYAVLGNHDYGMDAKNAPVDVQLATKVHEALVAVGVQMLNNEAVKLVLPRNRNQTLTRTGGGLPLYLVGIGDHWANKDKPTFAVAQVPRGAARLVFMHNPDSFKPLPSSTAPLAMAAHTHGGQVRIPFLPEWSWMTFAKEDEVHADAWISGYGQPGNKLYVNRGIGFSIIPIRINCPPEITFFTLQPSR